MNLILIIFAVFPILKPTLSSDIQYGEGENLNKLFWRRESYKWPRGRVPYIVSSNYTQRETQVIQEAIREWETRTCVRFIRRTNERDYVEITPNDGTNSYCYCHVGRQGRGRQYMKMYGECMRRPAMIHELGHAIGFQHEHQRPDRDDFITVHYQNIERKYHFAFDKFSDRDTTSLGMAYDYASVMHYPYRAFATGNGPSMTLKDGSTDRIRREAERLSQLDIEKVHKYYNNCR